MSEFSDSYHLRCSLKNDAVALLERAGISGYVFEPENDWVTIVPEGMPFVPNERLISANIGVLVHYIYTDDHGWGFEVYVGPQQVSIYECHWDPEFSIQGNVSVTAIQDALGRADSDTDLSNLTRVLEPHTYDDVLAMNPAGVIAEWLGLTNYSWVSFSTLDADFGDADSDWPGVTRFP